jgi:O-antigen biosynthesis protein WbqV
MAAASFAIALYLRLGDEALDSLIGPLFRPWVFFTAICAGVFWFSRVSRGIWRYVSMQDMIVIARAVTLALLLYLLLTFFVTRLEAVPRSTLVINWLVLAMLLSAPRMAYRMFKDGGLQHLLKSHYSDARIPMILIGTGDSAEVFTREIARDPNTPYEVLGLINEDRSKTGLSIHGLQVVGYLGDLPNLLDQYAARGKTPQRLILTRPLQREQMQSVMEVAEAAGITVARLPRLTDFKSGAGDGIEIQPIAVEDLLGRTQTKLDHAAMRRQIEGRRVLVTGAGGSIGSELVRQVASFSPAHLSLLDASETLLYAIDLEIGELHPDLSRSAILADVRDREKLDQVMAEEQPSLVFHAAALKHVPLVEANKIEGVLTNAIGTRHVADACCNAGVDAMVLISTDKAVNPTSTMGAAKRLAEGYCQAVNAAKSDLDLFGVVPENGSEDWRLPRFITVRFGNVLGSNGSVVPLFERQLAKGGPLTITHPDMCRYFMTISEAVELVLQASVMGLEEPDSNRDSIYVLDMGKPVKIIDLAHQMIRLAGLKPGEDVEIKVTGLRAGEKLSEDLFHNSEPLKPTTHPGLRLASPRYTDLKTLRGNMDALAEACRQRQENQVTWLLQKFVPEFQTAENERSLLQLYRLPVLAGRGSNACRLGN